MSNDPDLPVDEPDDGGERDTVSPPSGDEVPPKHDEPVGDFGDPDQADPGGDSDPDA